MSEVIGPIKFTDWYFMRQLLSSINWMKETGKQMYQDAIEKEQALYEETKKKYVA